MLESYCNVWGICFHHNFGGCVSIIQESLKDIVLTHLFQLNMLNLVHLHQTHKTYVASWQEVDAPLAPWWPMDEAALKVGMPQHHDTGNHAEQWTLSMNMD